ncbi:hypothetical protein [Nonomuraea jabiensis]|uniref:hypothetical protein n=1 Tax=Nonomuraea jabiensis TaxID=882448 RepID=UPI003D74455B
MLLLEFRRRALSTKGCQQTGSLRVRDRRDLPAIDTDALVGLGCGLLGLDAITIALTGGYGGKYHRPADPDVWTRCRHARYGGNEGHPQPLLAVYSEICGHCGIQLPAAQDALWRGAALLARTAREVEIYSHHDGPARPWHEDKRRSWVGYARLRAVVEGDREAQLNSHALRVATDPALKRSAAKLRAGWRTLKRRWQDALDVFAERCPPAALYADVLEAVDRCATSPARDEVERLARAASIREALGPLFTGTWAGHRLRATDAKSTTRAVQDAAATVLRGAQVTDVSALPAPQLNPADYASPAQWATAEFQLWWPEVVSALCQELEAAMPHASGPAEQRLLLTTGWPFTHGRAAPHAHLAAFERTGPLVPHGYSPGHGAVGRYGCDPSPTYAAVLIVPKAIVDRIEAAPAAMPDPCSPQLIPGPKVGKQGPSRSQVHALLRQAFPYLPTDAQADADAPSATLRTHRAATRSAAQVFSTTLDEVDLHELRHLFAEGHHVWIPGEPSDLAQLEHFADWGSLRAVSVDLECGPRSSTFPARIFGSITGIAVHEIHLSANVEHHPIAIPMNRIIAIRADTSRYRRASWYDDCQKVWEPLAAHPAPNPLSRI